MYSQVHDLESTPKCRTHNEANTMAMAQQTCSAFLPLFTLGPRSRPTVRVNSSIIMPNNPRVSAASHRPLDDSSRMKACCACTSMNYHQHRVSHLEGTELTEKVMPASSMVLRISVRPARSTCVS